MATWDAEFMSGSDRALTPWDLALLDRHRPFYTALASGTRQPTTALQAHFVAVAHGHSLPVTQHEIAFRRFREGWRDPRSERAGLRDSGASGALMPGRIERCVDLADAAQLETLASRAGRTFQHMRELYIIGKATARRRGTDAAVWINTALADAGVAGPLERWTSEEFGGLSNIYTKALDGAFAKGPGVGAEYVSPWLHRLFENHTPASAWQAVRDALPDDTPAQELIGWLQALGSDFVTVVGLPLVELTPEAFRRLEFFLSDMFGLSREQLVDALQVNAVEGLQFFASGCIPLVAAAMGWGEQDASAFARLAGGLGVGGIVAANPIMVVVVLLMLARAYQLAKNGEAQGLWRPTVEGGATTGMALGIAAAIGGPPILGLAAGLVVAGGLKSALNGRSGIEGPRWVDRSATRFASIISTLQSGQGPACSPVGL